MHGWLQCMYGGVQTPGRTLPESCRSQADAKSMRTMKDKAIPIHNRCKPPVKASAPTKPEDHIMMDHSPADAKSMRTMKDKKIPIHRSGAADPVEGDSPPKK